MSLPDKKIVPFDASLGALLPAGEPDQQVSRLHYLRLAMPTSRFMSDTSSPSYALTPNLGDFVVSIGDDEYKVYPGDKGFLFLVAMTAPQWKRIDRNGNKVGQPYNTKPKDLDWVPNPDKPAKKICIATSTGDAKTADRYDRQMLVYVLIEGLYPQLIYFTKTAREYGDWIANRAARWPIERKPAPMIGLFRLTSELTNDAEGHHWPLPKPTLVGKLGQLNGPDIAWVRRAAELRRALKGDTVFETEDPETRAAQDRGAIARPPAADAQGRFAGFHHRSAGGEQRTAACAAAARSLRRSRRRHPRLTPTALRVADDDLLPRTHPVAVSRCGRAMTTARDIAVALGGRQLGDDAYLCRCPCRSHKHGDRNRASAFAVAAMAACCCTASPATDSTTLSRRSGRKACACEREMEQARREIVARGEADRRHAG